MGQLNVYVPDDLEKKIKAQAKCEGKSVSAYVVDAVRQRIEPEGWSPEFLSLLGSEPTEFPDVEDLPPQQRPSFDD